MFRDRAKLAHQSNEGKQQRQTSYIRLSAEVMTTPILYTIKETSSQLFDLSTVDFRHQEKHSCTLPSVEKTNKYANEWQTTDNAAI